MHTKAILFVLALAIAVPCLADPNPAADDELQAVERATSAFYASLNNLFAGDASGMDDVWSHAADVSYMGPGGGYQVGWEQVRANWQSQAALRLGGKVEPREMHTTVGGDLAFSECYEVGNNVDVEGRPIAVSIRATNLFRKENGQWKMIGHHTDLLPYLENPSAIAPIE